ncbi:MAG: GNAT family N-acetyltransferase, partial [Candidatus Saccharibacteria bacterium]|nr:GNAT family N-acetyltransferase [Candidatus Saccharibacteria bacterium]
LPLVKLAFQSFDSDYDEINEGFSDDNFSIATVNGVDVGFIFTNVLDTFRPGEEILWVSKLAVRHDIQASGIGGRLLAACKATKWLGCTTQNPALVRLFQSQCTGVYPIDASYAQFPELLEYAKSRVDACSTSDSHGLVAGLFGEQLGTFDKKLEFNQLHSVLETLGFQFQRGDALVLIGDRRPQAA